MSIRTLINAALEVISTITARAAAGQDGVRLQGRAGGTSGFNVVLTPLALGATRTHSLQDADMTYAGINYTNTWTANQTLQDINIILGTGAGTKIGTAVGQKLAFWNATPIVQPAGAAQAQPAAQGQQALTDSTGGTASTTLAAITAGASYAQADMTAVKNALASLAARLAEIRTDVTNIKTHQNEVRTVLVNVGIMKGAA